MNRAGQLPLRAGLVAVVVLLASCGGGGSDSGTKDAPSDVARLECQVVDSVTDKPVADARVTYQAKTSVFATTTNAGGNCRIDMPPAEVLNVPYPAATVTKSGYEPQTILCESLRAGKSCYQEVRLNPLSPYISIPVGGDTVMHLGDDDFEGSVNSQFQKATDGTELLFPIPDWAEKVKLPDVTTATVYLDAKGWQSDVCSNLIEIVGDAGTASLKGGISPREGYWAGGRQVPFVFKISEIGLLQAQLRIVSGTCRSTIDRDDFEINRIRVEFN